MPPRIPNRLRNEAEFLLLMDLKQRTNDRLNELIEILDPCAPDLPLSCLKAAAPGVLLFKGDRR